MFELHVFCTGYFGGNSQISEMIRICFGLVSVHQAPIDRKSVTFST